MRSSNPQETPIYQSSNGDAWYLSPDVETHRLWVRHQRNRTSGGRSSLIDLEAFLSEGHGPQQEALSDLLHDIGYLLPAA